MRGNIFYRRELQNTYLVAADCKKEILESFTGRMILKGKIQGIIPCSIRLIDGKREVHYDISSLRTLEQAYAVKEMDRDLLVSIIEQIDSVMEEMDNNLADGNGVCFDPEYMYIDTDNDRLYFIYDFTEEHKKSGILSLAEYCLERVKQEDGAAVDLVYYFYEHARGDHFSLKEVENYLDEKHMRKRKDPDRGDDEIVDYPNDTVEIKESDPQIPMGPSSHEAECPGPVPVLYSANPDYTGDSLYSVDNDKDHLGLKEKKGTKIPLKVLAALCGLLAVISLTAYGVLCIDYVFDPLIEIGWISVSGILVVASAVLLITSIRKEAGEDDEADTGISQSGELDNYAYEEEIMNMSPVDMCQGIGGDMIEGSILSEGNKREQNDGKTVYVGREERQIEHALIGRHRGRDVEYPIQKYPWIVGTERDRVNLHIKEDSVSRIHARFTRDDDSVFIEDLASTNGTTLNDLPLSPKEKMKLRRGDIILFGRAEYVFE